ncbi:hypothetical protein CVT24_012736 [Panaeolus cyanescens]|uniref:Uncharacterized protein n=1 Tax=Panaeolus cyanescens TaxID=181874 RepID=A0A409W6U3_9AGAR|nr:hypothetical protein CVT24_012736 [Panaeolus cyanescens]
MAVTMMDAVNLRGFSQVVSEAMDAFHSLALYRYGFKRPEQDFKRAPILGLPVELIREILKASLEPTEEEEDYRPCHYPIVSEGCRRSPIELSHVCRLWRNIVNNAPELWSQITFIHPSYRQLEPTAHWLARLKDHNPLTIYLYQFGDDSGYENDDSLGPLLNLLMTKAHHWHVIDFRLNGSVNPDVMESLSRIQNVSSSTLVDARISVNPDNATGSSGILPIFKAWDAFRKVSSLSSFRWRAPFTPGTVYSSKIRVLEINSPISVEVLLENLQSCPLLELLNVDKVELASDSIIVDPQHRDMPVDPPALVVLPHLIHLHISAKVSLYDIFTRLHAPSLHILQIAGLDVRERKHLLNFLRKNDHPLSNLGLQFVSRGNPGQDTHLSANETKDYLQALYDYLQLVRSLHIIGATFDLKCIEVFQRPMTAALECEDFFPHLENLGLSKIDAAVDEGVLLRMLSSRYWDFSSRTKRKVALLQEAKIHVDELTDETEKYVNMIARCGYSDGIARSLNLYVS